jgi:multiple sugar transport system substrate-binding protein
MDDPLIQLHPEDMQVVFDAVAYGRSLGWESPDHPPNQYAGALNAANILPQMIQRVVLQGEAPETATAWAKAEILRIQAEVDAQSSN